LGNGFFQKGAIRDACLLVLFCIASFADLFLNRLFAFSPELLIIGGSGIPLMLGLSTLFVLVEFYAALVRWKHIEWHERAIMVLTALFLLFSLVLFEVFRQPHMLSPGSAFMMLLSLLSWQRKELLLDWVTRIPNNQACMEVRKSYQHRTILLLDIENFRLLNERYGEDGGNAILSSFADLLKTTYEQAEIFRIGGNRFVLMLPCLTHNELVRKVIGIKEKPAKKSPPGDMQVPFTMTDSNKSSSRYVREDLISFQPSERFWWGGYDTGLLSADHGWRWQQTSCGRGLDAKKMGFEVAESMVLSSDPVGAKSWQALRNMDGLGTGYANLEPLVKPHL
jgi:GGDEF domain-containing protein